MVSWCSVGDRSVCDSWCSVCEGSCLDGLEGEGSSSDGFNGDLSRFFVDDGVETVDGIGGVVYDSTGTVGFEKRVATVNNVTVAALMLALEVTGERVLNVVTVAVLRIRIVIGVDRLCYNCLGQRSSRCVSERCWSESCWSYWKETSVCCSHQGEQSYELETKINKLYIN